MPEDVRFPARDGDALAGTLFPAERPRGTVVVASAMGVRRRLYARFAERLAGGGLTTLTFDYRGIGGSRRGPLRGFAAELHDWGELDLAGAIDWLAARHRDLPLQLVTHSVGGQIFGLIEETPAVGAVFLASQSGSWRLWRGLPRLGMFFVWHLAVPGLARAFGYLPMRAIGQGEDLPAGVAREWAAWGRRDEYVWSYAGPRGGRGFRRWTGTLRAYAIADDGYAPQRGVEALAAMYSRARVEVRTISPGDFGLRRIGHFGLFRPELGAAIWDEIDATLHARLAELAGGEGTPSPG